MATIFQVTKGNARQDLLAPFVPDTQPSWRDDLVPAQFRGANFHVEMSSKQGGSRVVVHEFPKRDMPYAENMGRRAQEFTVRGYCIQFMFDLPRSNSRGEDWRFMRDYRLARDALVNECDSGLAGLLQLPTMAPLWVRCSRYSLSEEEKYGGYCVIDMTFVEFGLTPNPDQPQTRQNIIDQVASEVFMTIVNMAPTTPYQAQALTPLAYGPFAPVKPYMPRELKPVSYGPQPSIAAAVAQKLKPVAFYGLPPALAAPQSPPDISSFPGNPPYWG